MVICFCICTVEQPSAGEDEQLVVKSNDKMEHQPTPHSNTTTVTVQTTSDVVQQ